MMQGSDEARTVDSMVEWRGKKSQLRNGKLE